MNELLSPGHRVNNRTYAMKSHSDVDAPTDARKCIQGNLSEQVYVSYGNSSNKLQKASILIDLTLLLYNLYSARLSSFYTARRFEVTKTWRCPEGALIEAFQHILLLYWHHFYRTVNWFITSEMGFQISTKSLSPFHFYLFSTKKLAYMTDFNVIQNCFWRWFIVLTNFDK